MSYRASRARKELELQLDQAVRELTPLYRLAQKIGGGGGSRLLAAYYVFAFAQLEIYVKSLVEDSLNAMSVSKPHFTDWPDLMLGYLFHKSENLGSEYRKYSISEDEGPILAKVAETARKIAAWGNGVPLGISLSAAAFLDKKKYPSPRNLPQLFRRLGVKKVWPLMDAAGRLNSELILISLNDLRTGIAHEGKVPPGFGLIDFRDRLDQMRRFVRALDRGVSKHFCTGVMPRAIWNQSMS